MRRAAGTVISALLVLSTPALGATFEPTRFDDPPPGKCKPGDCSLREAFIAANKEPGADAIKLGDGTYKLTIPETLSDPNDSSAGDLDAADQLKLTGLSAKATAISGTDVTRVLHVQGTFTDYTIRKLTLTRGEAGEGDGGALITTNTGGRTALKKVVIKKSNAESGGAIKSAGIVRLSKSTISGNEADFQGGGIFLPTVSGANPASAEIISSTVSGNEAGFGGGLSADGFDPGGFPAKPVATIENSTFAENNAAVSGGGAAAIQGATITADHSTFGYNGADSDGEGGGFGGGVFQSSSASFTIANSLVTQNTVNGDLFDPGAACFGTFTGPAVADGGLVGCTFTGTSTPDALVGPFGKHGGPTKTIPVLPGSPAIDRVGGTSCPPLDQRGKARPTNIDLCDFGAFERKPSDD